MEWYNVKHQKPAHHQTVLVSINGIYRIADFDEHKNGFLELTTSFFYSLDDKGLSMYWTEIEQPLK